jgi:hypothetical protein
MAAAAERLKASAHEGSETMARDTGGPPKIDRDVAVLSRASDSLRRGELAGAPELQCFGNGCTIYGGSDVRSVERRLAHTPNAPRVITITVVDPWTRKPVSVTYDRQTKTYLDNTLKRWLRAPGWMNSQIR